MPLVFSVTLGGMGTKDVFIGASDVGHRMPNLVQHLFLSLRLGNVVHLRKMGHFVLYSKSKTLKMHSYTISLCCPFLFWDNGMTWKHGLTLTVG